MANQYDFQDMLDDMPPSLDYGSRQLFKRTREIIAQVTYKPTTGFRVLRDRRGIVFLQHFQFVEDCNGEPGELTEQRGRKFYISQHMTDEEIVRTALLAVKVFENHEAHEWFRWKGERYLNPHPEGQRDE